MRMPFACALINQNLVVRCELPEAGKQTTVTFDLLDRLDPPSQTRKPAALQPGYGATDADAVDSACSEPNSFAFNIRYSSPNLVPSAGLSYHGLLVLDDGPHVDLGCVALRCRSNLTETTLPHVPRTASFVVTGIADDAAAAASSEEEAGVAVDTATDTLLSHVQDCMEDDDVNPRHGSLPASLVQSLAMRCPAYNAVIGSAAHKGRFTSFLEAHAEFTVFLYHKQGDDASGDVECGGVGGADEPRVVLRKGKRVQFSEEGEEAVLVSYLQDLLVERDYTMEDLLAQLHEDGMGFGVSPGFSQLMRFLSRNKKMFSWSTDPSQITMVKLADFSAQSGGDACGASSGAAADAVGGGGGKARHGGRHGHRQASGRNKNSARGQCGGRGGGVAHHVGAPQVGVGSWQQPHQPVANEGGGGSKGGSWGAAGSTGSFTVPPRFDGGAIAPVSAAPPQAQAQAPPRSPPGSEFTWTGPAIYPVH